MSTEGQAGSAMGHGPHNVWPSPWPSGGQAGPALGPRGPGPTHGQCTSCIQLYTPHPVPLSPFVTTVRIRVQVPCNRIMARGIQPYTVYRTVLTPTPRCWVQQLYSHACPWSCAITYGHSHSKRKTGSGCDTGIQKHENIFRGAKSVLYLAPTDRDRIFHISKCCQLPDALLEKTSPRKWNM